MYLYQNVHIQIYRHICPKKWTKQHRKSHKNWIENRTSPLVEGLGEFRRKKYFGRRLFQKKDKKNEKKNRKRYVPGDSSSGVGWASCSEGWAMEGPVGKGAARAGQRGFARSQQVFCFFVNFYRFFFIPLSSLFCPNFTFLKIVLDMQRNNVFWPKKMLVRLEALLWQLCPFHLTPIDLKVSCTGYSLS